MSISAVVLIVLGASIHLHAEAGTSATNLGRAIDWTDAGVGTIPARTKLCANLTTSASLEQINAALAACPGGETVYLAAGTYSIPGTVTIPSNVTLRGAGAGKTILNAIGTEKGAVIGMGIGSVAFNPLRITSGATAASSRIELTSAKGIVSGMYLAIAEINDLSYVSTAGSGGNCNWCDGGWTEKGSLARGQIVKVVGVSGNAVSISPDLYNAYANTPMAVPFRMSAEFAGVEDLQVYANNTGYDTNFSMAMCAYCWMKGVESNYADGDHVEIYWGFHDEIRDSYFSNAFLHGPGQHDSDIQIAHKTSASLVENNIVERTHIAIMLEWGAAGNVIAYNYTMGEFDSGAPNLDIGGIDFHGAHPQFNLLEGNVTTQIAEDSVWGTSSHTTAYRNWVVGTNRICGPMSGRGTVTCAGTDGHYGFQAARAIETTYAGTSNFFTANVVGSAQMQSLKGYSRPVAQQAFVEYPALRDYDGAAYGWSFGYGKTSDDGSGTGCAEGTPPCHKPGNSASSVIHGNFNNMGGVVSWAAGLTHDLPPSLYLSAKPAWWGTMPFPATGPDVRGGGGPGGHSYGNPARECYLRVMGGSDGGAGGPLPFDAGKCYGMGIPIDRVLPDNRIAKAGVTHRNAAGKSADGENR